MGWAGEWFCERACLLPSPRHLQNMVRWESRGIGKPDVLGLDLAGSNLKGNYMAVGPNPEPLAPG